MKLNLTLTDGTYLNSIILSTTNNDFSIGELKTKEQFEEWLQTDGRQRMYFCGKYVQGGISHPRIIRSYEVFEDNGTGCTLICNCGKTYNYIPRECDRCGNIFVD